MNNHCKVCNREKLRVFIEFDKYPKTISFLFDDEEQAKKDFTGISFVKCDYCHHVQISKDMPQEFYSDYVMTVSHSDKMYDFQVEQAEFFIKKFNLKNKTVLEVGCGDGNFLSLLKERNVTVWGNEPSAPFRKLALNRKLEVDELFVNENYFHPNAPFDAVVSREVMEHVPAPVEFLKNIRKILKPEGCVLIEVPNFEKALKDLRYYDMFPDHLSYFTRESLTAAMLISGFKNVEIFYGMDEEFIYATAQNHYIENRNLISAKEIISNDFEELFSKFKNIVIWGAGGKGIATLGSLNEAKKIKYVVDSDNFKQEKYLPSSGIVVKPPSVLFDDKDVDLLVITNLAYTDEILKILKENNFNRQIKILSKNGIVDIK